MIALQFCALLLVKMAVHLAIHIVVKGGSDFWAPVVNLARDGTDPVPASYFSP